RLRGDHPRAAGVCGVGAHRPSRGGVSARPGRATPRVVSGDGCAARGRRRAVRDRARDRGDGPCSGPLSSRVAAVFRGPVRSPYGSGRPPRAMSASLKIPMPLRVPDLAPSLGRVRVPRRLEAPLVPVDAMATRVREASVLDKAAHAEWQEALRAAARRLEAAWLALETQVADEHRRWADEIDAVARWRPSLWPLVALWTPLGVALVWLGLVLGGYLPAPAWLAARLGF